MGKQQTIWALEELTCHRADGQQLGGSASTAAVWLDVMKSNRQWPSVAGPTNRRTASSPLCTCSVLPLVIHRTQRNCRLSFPLEKRQPTEIDLSMSEVAKQNGTGVWIGIQRQDAGCDLSYWLPAHGTMGWGTTPPCDDCRNLEQKALGIRGQWLGNSQRNIVEGKNLLLSTG